MSQHGEKLEGLRKLGKEGKAVPSRPGQPETQGQAGGVRLGGDSRLLPPPVGS